MLYVGSVDHQIQSDISAAIKDAGGRAAARSYAVQVPIDAAAIEKRLANRPTLAKYAGADQLRTLGRQLGREFVTGGDTPIWNALHNVIVQEATPRFGTSKRPADAVIVVRTADPQTGETAPFVKGLYEGIARRGRSGRRRRAVDKRLHCSSRCSSRRSCRPSTTSISPPASSRSRSCSVSRRLAPTTASASPDLLPPVTPVLTPSG